MYRVLESGKPARYPEIELDPSWNNCDFQTIEEAIEYARKYLGEYFPAESDISPIFFDVPYDYSGYGDTIQIIVITQEGY